MTPDPTLWKAFNVQLRLLGIGALFAGVVTFVTYGLGWPAIPGEPASPSPIALIGGGFITLLGLGFLMLKPYRPDLGDRGLPLNPFRPAIPRRWWTGDPID